LKVLKTRKAVALVHHPIVDKIGDIVATNITNYDIHDIARACRVYGIDKYYIVHPAMDQHIFLNRILEHWRLGFGSQYNALRKTALGMVEAVSSIEEAKDKFELFIQSSANASVEIGNSLESLNDSQASPVHSQQQELEAQLRPIKLIATSAKESSKNLRFEELRSMDSNVMLIFGTGYGLHSRALEQCDHQLEPIRGASEDDYRHLSVRSAVSICLDRWLSR
jgi:hypothetical protein